MIRRSVHQESQTEATLPALPHPLPLMVSEDDGSRRSERITYLFDFAGEVCQRRISNEDPLTRQRLVSCDGFLLFLDLTQSMESQRDEIVSQLLIDLRLRMRANPKRSLTPPLAICVSKLDLLHAESAGGQSDSAGIYFEGLKKVDSSTYPFSAECTLARSTLTRDLLRSCWPDWQIERDIKATLGMKTQFFPVGPLGICDASSERQVSRYAVLEPLTWLIDGMR